MIAMKRPAAAVVAASQAKKQRQDEVTAKCKRVASFVEAAEGLPKNVARMLAGTVKCCLSDPEGERHELQEKMLGMLSGALATEEKGNAEKVSALRKKLDQAQEEKASCVATAEKLAAAAAERTALLDATQETAAAAAGAVRECEDALACVRAQQKILDDLREEAGAKKKLLETTVNDFGALPDGSSSDARKRAKALVAVARGVGVDPHILMVAPAALTTEPASRSAFDNTVLQHLQEGLSSAIARVAEQVETYEKDQKVRSAEEEAAVCRLDAGAQGAAEAEATVAEAQTALQVVEADRRAAEKTVKELGPEIKKLAAEVHAAEEDLKACQEVSVAFQELVSRAIEADVQEPGEEPEEAVELQDTAEQGVAEDTATAELAAHDEAAEEDWAKNMERKDAAEESVAQDASAATQDALADAEE